MDGTHIKLTTGGDIITQHTRPRVDNYGWHGLIRNGYEIFNKKQAIRILLAYEYINM